MFCAQGYEVSDEELQVSLKDFGDKYSDHMGYPEYAIPWLDFLILKPRKKNIFTTSLKNSA